MSYTTGKLAALFQVSRVTARKWIDTGLLKSWRVPGSKFRRVERAEVERFAKEHQLPWREL